MTKMKLAPHTDNIVHRYRSGESAASIGRHFGASTTTVTSLLKRVGAMKSRPRGVPDDSIVDDRLRAVRLFNAGHRPAVIIRKLGRSKSWLYSVLGKSGVELRGIDGWTPTTGMLERAAIGRESNPTMTEAETVLYGMLSKEGIRATPQLAIRAGNVDFGISTHSVAVELCCRGTFPKNVTNGWIRDRIKDLADAGWHAYILVCKDADALRSFGAEDLFAWLDFMKRQPAIERQYRMVRSPYNLLATGRSDDKYLSGVLSPENSGYPAYRKDAS